jgi:hypothetical protein
MTFRLSEVTTALSTQENLHKIRTAQVESHAGEGTVKHIVTPRREHFPRVVALGRAGTEIRGIPPFAKSAKDPGLPTARPQRWQRVRLSVRKAA